MHGLATDTDDFIARARRPTSAPPRSSPTSAIAISSQDLSRRLIAPSAMDVIARALAALVVRRNFAMAGVGFVAESERDTIAQAADFLIRREDIDTVVVYGIVGDRFIEGSLRTHSPSVDPAVWLEQAFGHDERGKRLRRRSARQGRLPHPDRLPRPRDRSRAALGARRARGAPGAPQAARRRALPASRHVQPPRRLSRAHASSMRIAFVGLPLAALLLARDGHEHRLRRRSAATRRSARAAPRRRSAHERRRACPTSRRRATTSASRAREPELVVSWFWTRSVPAALRALAPLGAIGVHPSLLPRHRGPDPYFWAIDAGDDVTGVTAHVLERRVRHGRDPRGSASSRSIRRGTRGRSRRSSIARRSRFLREVVKRSRRHAPPRPQDEALATEAPAPTENMLEIRWTRRPTRSRGACARRARGPARSPRSAARRSCCSNVKPTRDFPRALEPGEAFVREDGIAVVRAEDHALELRLGRNEGDDALLDAAAIARLLSA